MSKIIQFGETIEGYDIPVLNEREIRAAAGLMFLMMMTAFMHVVLLDEFLILKYTTTIFLLDFFIRVFVSPRFSPTLILGKLIVRDQAAEYVGAPQKKFAWSIGLALASIFFLHLVIANAVSLVSGLICMVCLVFLFFETAFGICLGCKFYPLFFKENTRYCAGQECSAVRSAMRHISVAQLSVVVGLAIFMTALVFFFGDFYNKKPYILFETAKVSHNIHATK